MCGPCIATSVLHTCFGLVLYKFYVIPFTVSVGLNILTLFSVLGSDHGVKAHGDGWLLTVALIEGTGITTAGSSDLFDVYVVFTCNAKKKTSSIKFHTSDPKWNG